MSTRTFAGVDDHPYFSTFISVISVGSKVAIFLYFYSF